MIKFYKNVNRKLRAGIEKSVFLILCSCLLSACAGSIGAGLATDDAKPTLGANTTLEACLGKVMQLKLGTWDYTGVIARMNGSFRTYVTRSVHGKSNDGTLTFQSFGGDVYDESISYSRLVASRMLPVIEGVQQQTGIQFTSCSGPDIEGRYFTSSEYTLPPEEGDTSIFYVKAASTFSKSGSYFSEDIVDDTGRIIAQRAGVTLPVTDTKNPE